MRFFLKHRDATTLYVLGRSLIEDHRPLVKDIRALDPNVVASMVRSLQLFSDVRVLEKDSSQLDLIRSSNKVIVFPDEDESREIVAEHFLGLDVQFEPVFLRWDRTKSLSQDPVMPDRVVTSSEVHSEMMRLAFVEAKRSVDWWRQVGAIVSKDNQILAVAHNEHVPSGSVLYALGDPRGNFRRGVHFEISTVLHSEAALVSWAARTGTSLSGTDLYVTTFPCPPCSKVVAYSGVKRLFYMDGYAVLDGQDVLESQNIEIVQVKI